MAMKHVYERRTFSEEEEIISQGGVATNAFMIQEGLVEVSCTYEGGHTTLARLGPGEIFGEMALIAGRKNMATVKALEKTTCFVVSPRLLEEKMARSDPLVNTLLKALVQRLGKADIVISKHEESAP